ncbi:hypothetical protein COP2_007220 [Malus domestica]
MAIANLQAQITNLTSQLTQYIERTTMKSVPTCGVSYGHGYPTHQRPQFTTNGDSWGYQGYDQPSNNMFSNTYNSNWSDHSNYMWGEPQQFQQDGYWQQEEEFYSKPMQPPPPPPEQFQSNSSMPMSYDEILDVLTFLTQGSQQEEYSQPSEEFYQWPYAPPQPRPQSSQTNSGTLMDNDQIVQLLTSLTHEAENQANKMDKLEKQVGQIVEFMAQIQEQSEFSNANIVNSMEDFEITGAITLGSAMEVGVEPMASKQIQGEDEHLLIEGDEEDTPTARVEQPLPQPPRVPMPSNSGKLVPNSILSNPIPPNVPFPRRFLIPKQEEREKDIVEALPKVQNDILILGATKQVLDCVELFKGLCTPRRMIQEKVVAGECQEFIKEDVFDTPKPKEVKFDDTGQITTIVVNLAKFKVPETFKEVVFVIEFMSEHTGKPPPRISILVYTNMLLMIQAPTLEFKPLPDHFKYHLPFKDQLHDVGPIQA